MDEILEDVPPFARRRIPYLSSPVQPPIDRYTVLPSRSTSTSNSPTLLRLPLNPPPAVRSPSATHRRYHSHQSYYNRPQYQGHDLEHDSYFTPVPTPLPSPPAPTRMVRRYTVFLSPPISPSSLSTLSSPRRDIPFVKAEATTAALKHRPSVVHSNSSSTDSLVATNDPMRTNRMMVTNPDSDIDSETDTEPEVPSSSGGRGSPSATDIIRLYGRDLDRDQDTSSVLKKDSPTV